MSDQFAMSQEVKLPLKIKLYRGALTYGKCGMVIPPYTLHYP